MLPDGSHQPYDAAPYDKDVDGCQREIPQPELNRSEDQIGDDVDQEGNGHHTRDPLPRGPDEYEPKGHDDDGVDNLPHEPDERGFGRPRRLCERVVPVHERHSSIILLPLIPASGIAQGSVGNRNYLTNYSIVSA